MIGANSRLEILEREILDLESAYYPNQAVCQHLGDISLVQIIGPVAIGKTTIMNRLPEIDSDFGKKIGFATRPARTTEPDLTRIRPHTPTGLRQIKQQVKAGDLVQYKVHPETKFIYGSEVLDYQKPFVTLDTMASAVEKLRTLPFRKVTDIAITAPAEEWAARFAHRAKTSDVADSKKRLVEGRKSIEWCLGQGSNLSWVVNRDQALDLAAYEVIGLAKDNLAPTPSNRTYAQKMLKVINRLINP